MQEANETAIEVYYGHPDTFPVIPPNTTDWQFLDIWLCDRPSETQDAYRRDASRFLFFLMEEAEQTRKRPGVSLIKQATLPDLQGFAETLDYLKPASKARVLKAIKSLFTFAEKAGFKEFNVGAAVRLPKVKRRLAQRILSEEQVHSIIAQEQGNPRNHALLRFLYISGARVSEACTLCWADVQDREFEMGQVTLDGKGEKERTVLLPASMYQELKQLRTWEETRLKRSLTEADPVFLSRGGHGKKRGGAIDPSQVHRIVEAAALAANVQVYQGERKRTNKGTNVIEVQQVMKSRVSPHYLRHAHASHALDRGVPPHVVMETLGHASLETLTIYTHVKPSESSALKLAS
ncbi:MAG TPA: tyrosine-type recombinase/integrase [Nitrososphaera sp.]|jgi:integrase/recombinase XerD|nr:tyrosine-type recombinase/integrase [Nitrososphaera sp.]